MKRSQAAIALGGTIALGIVSRRVPLGVFVWDKSLGDALYTVMLYFMFALVRPSWEPQRLAVVAIGLSFAIELFQLTSIPAGLPRILQIALGTRFAWHDVVCYVIGGALVALVDALVRRRAR